MLKMTLMKIIHLFELDKLSDSYANLLTFTTELRKIMDNLYHSQMNIDEEKSLDFAVSILREMLDNDSKELNNIRNQFFDDEYIGIDIDKLGRKKVYKRIKEIYNCTLIQDYLENAIKMGRIYGYKFAKPLITTDITFK